MNSDFTKPQRIISIDALRGFDMLFIIFIYQFVTALHAGANTPLTAFLAKQCHHPEWLGSAVFDIVMPLFLFLVGAAIPFALSQRMQQSTGKSAIYWKLIKRFVVLFILGWIVQGNLLAFDLTKFYIFSNTLQAIAVGYLFSSLAYIHLKQKWRYVLFAACLVLYALILTVPTVPGMERSVLLPDRNFAIYFDRLVFGRFDDGNQYTWLLSGLGFTATTLSGVFAGELIKSTLPRKKVALVLVVLGICGLSLGLVWGIWHPIIKKLWTSSFVLASSGICYLLLAMFYWIIDIKGFTKWAFPLKVIGMNAITAYIIAHVLKLQIIANFLLFGLAQYTGAYHGVLTSIGGFGILYLLLWCMYRNKTFIKV